MDRRTWTATPVIILTMLLAAAAAIIMIGNVRTAVPTALDRSAAPATDRARALTRDTSPSRTGAVEAPDHGQPQAAPGRSVAGKAMNKPASKPAKRQQAGPAGQPKGSVQADPMANTLGWRVGTQWTVKVEEFADYLAQSRWVSTSYVFKVISADPKTGSFTVSQRFADPSIQPEAARGDLLRVGYILKNGSMQLAWVQPEGTGPQLPARQAKGVLGNNTISLELPATPFSSGQAVQVRAPGLGEVGGSKVSLGRAETATFAKGAPWWVSYTRGDSLRARMTGFKK